MRFSETGKKNICAQAIALALMFFVLLSCNKTGSDNTTGQSAGTLKSDSTFQCVPATIHGFYYKDSVLHADNFIDVHVNVTRAGEFSIESNNVNGYSFKGSAAVGILGDNTIRLYGSGTPILAGTDQFLFRYGTSFCSFDVEVQQAGAEAVYTFNGAGVTCAGAIVSGTYITGQQMESTNTLTASIQITAPGSYFIATTELNGVDFSAEGFFADPAQASVVLTAHGTPLSAGTFNYPLIGNGTSCGFSVTFL